jgi:hypothetical protein
MYDIQHCFIYRPSDSIVSEDVIKPTHWLSDALTTRLEFIHTTRLDLIHKKSTQYFPYLCWWFLNFCCLVVEKNMSEVLTVAMKTVTYSKIFSVTTLQRARVLLVAA